MCGINARFMIFLNGSWVKITLRPGELLQWEKREPTEEGWRLEHQSYSFDGYIVTYTHVSDGRDCDGRLIERRELVCGLEELQGHITREGWRMPLWDKRQVSIYDEYAQRMGY